MDRISAEKITTEYLKKIYGFSLTKTANLQDAQDLTQDIVLKLFSALQKVDVENVSAFIWRVAKNTLANYYRGKSRSGIGVPIDDLAETLACEDDLGKSIEETETIKKLQIEIAYLSKMQRKIIIMYYYENKKQDEIADILSIPVGTVKWHLFEAKKEMKKGMDTMRNANELKFNPIKFTIMSFSGSVGTMGGTASFFRNALAQNIAFCVYREAKSINEIADCLGVSPVYVESEVEFLEEYGFIIKKGNKYITNMLIDEPNENAKVIVNLQEEMYTKAANLFANDLYDTLAHSSLLDDEGVVVCNRIIDIVDDKPMFEKDKNFMLWSLIPYISAVSGDSLMKNTVSFDDVATIRPDGGKNIAYAGFESVNGPKQKYFDSILKWIGPCWNTNEKYMLWTCDSEWSKKRVDDNYQITAQRELALFSSFFDDNPLSEYDYAFMAEKGLMKYHFALTEKNSGSSWLSSQIVWIRDNEGKKKLIEIGYKIKEKYKDEFDKLKAPFVKAVMDNTPEHLKKIQAYGLQYIFFSDGWFLLYCLKEIVNNGKLKLPTEEQRKSLTTIIMLN